MNNLGNAPLLAFAALLSPVILLGFLAHVILAALVGGWKLYHNFHKVL